MKPHVVYALTLQRPWATLIVHGSKPLENRHWFPMGMIGQTIAIHAGKTFDENGWLAAQDIMRGLGEDPLSPTLWGHIKVEMAIVGTARIAGYTKVSDSPWFFGPIGWVLDERRPLATPVPCRGMQKLWIIPTDVRRAVEAQI